MTREEMIAVMEYLRSFYPNFYNKTTKDEANRQVTAWLDIYKDTPAEFVMQAVKYYVTNDVSGVPAVPGKLNAIIRMLHSESSENIALDAWEKTITFVRDMSRSWEADEEKYIRLPDLARKYFSYNDCRLMADSTPESNSFRKRDFLKWCETEDQRTIHSQLIAITGGNSGQIEYGN